MKKRKVKLLRKISLDIVDLMNDINAWLVDEDDDSMEDDLNELVNEADDEDDGHEMADHNTGEGITEDEKDSKE